MAKEAFARTISLTVVPSVAWATITDVPTLVSWVSVLRDATVTTELESYRAMLEDRLGMFSLKADLDINVVEHQAPDWIVVHAEGEDRQVGSRIVVDARVELQQNQPGSTLLEVTGMYEVTGKVATLGAGMIRKKASKVLDEFFGSVERAMG